MELDVLTDAIDRLGHRHPAAYADGESIETLQRQLARLEALVTEATAAFDGAGNWVPDGAHSATAWLVARCRLPRARARQMVRRGRELRHLPFFRRAWESGEITGDRVDVVARLRSPATEEMFSRDEEMLAGQACELSFRSFEKSMAYWQQMADPDGTEADEEKRRSRRDVYLERSFGGSWLGRITLDPISGNIVGGELARLEGDMFDADWAEARARLGHDPTVTDLARSGGQRRADALVEMARRSQTTPKDGRRSAPLFTVLVGYETLRSRVLELADGTVISPGSLLPWLDEAYIERAVFAPERRIEVSATARFFTGATRRALEIRDRECSHPYCDVPAASCQGDHITPYHAGGNTVLTNGRLLCGFHNRLRNGRPPPAD